VLDVTLARLGRRLACASWLGFAALVSPALASQPASASPEPERSAQAQDEASVASHHRRGVERYDAGDYALALAEFEQAYALSGDYRFLFNVGQLQYELRQFARARVSLERYLDEGRGLIPDARRDAVVKEVAELERRTGLLMVHLDGAPTLLEVQGQRSSASHDARFVVDAGSVRLVARRPGFAPIERLFDVAGGALVTLALEFVARPSAAQAPSAPEIQRAGSSLTPIAWTVAGVAGLGAVAAGTATWLSSNHYDRLREAPALASPERRRGQLDQQRQRVQHLALATDLLVVTALASSGIALYLTLSGSEPTSTALVIQPGQVAAVGKF
jgi:tetratricopeptide (TPR) repeat protein